VVEIKKVIGNWKMNKTLKETLDFFKYFIDLSSNIHCIIAPSFVNLESSVKAVEGTKIKIFAQNCNENFFGAFTGEVSPCMLENIGVSGVILGHSERRNIGETDEIINKKIKAALKFNLDIVLCIGESQESRLCNESYKVLGSQICEAFHGLAPTELEKVIIAYEPTWAIGSKSPASAQKIFDIVKWIKNFSKTNFKNNFEVFYGGSVNGKNCNEILKVQGIDGTLVGGASLDPMEFFKIVCEAALI
jgi:triosephosphate isomerase